MDIADYMTVHSGIAREHCLGLGLACTSRTNEGLDVYPTPLPTGRY